MEKHIATNIFESLSSGVRLDIFRLLVNSGLDGLVAGEIGSTLGLPPTNLSFHLKALTHSGLVTSDQEGRYHRFRANISVMSDLIDYMTKECCNGNPSQCDELPNSQSSKRS